ncbi:MAG: exonuclease subunit SbcD [Trueperella sp.]|nr:exonuclease subunit SbcD [Trueperella sp.]
MRIFHTSDWHLGRSLLGFDLTPAFERWGAAVVEICRTEKVDAVVVAGDVYDRSVPPAHMVELLSDILRQLTEFTQVVLISGNHDSAQRLGFASPLLRSGLSIRTNSLDCGTPIELADGNGNLGAQLYAVPYLVPDIERSKLAPDAEPLARSHSTVMAAALERVQHGITAHANRAVPQLLTAHTFVVGAEKSESELEIGIGGVDSVPASLFRLGAATGSGPLDYVALGHLHGPQQVGGEDNPLMRYSGSPIAFSFSEQNHHKSGVLLDFTAAGTAPQLELIPHEPWRPLATLTDTLDNLLSRKYDDYSDHFLRIFVTDPIRPEHLNAKLNNRFRYVLEVQHQTRETMAIMRELRRQRTDPLAVVHEFFANAGGRELTATEKEIVTTHWNSAKGEA